MRNIFINSRDNMEDKITFKDIQQYEHLITKVPSFLLGRMAKKNSNVVNKFKGPIQSYLVKLNADQKRLLGIVLESDVDELQALMKEAHDKTKIKQYKILANPKHKEFIEHNIEELKKLV